LFPQHSAFLIELFDNNPSIVLDEAGFHSQLIKSRSWSKVGDPAIVKVYMQKGVNICIVGCISPFGTVCFSKIELLNESDVAPIKKEFPGSSPSKKKKAGSKSELKPI
jgi:hypothetical protein